MRQVYQERRDIALEGLKRMGWNVKPPQGSFYFWIPVPKNYTAASFSEAVLEKAGVIVTPGSGYGDYGEGYVRIALTIDKQRMIEAFDRMEKAFGKVEF
jgi:LL-diaminopimelate aminotransferase